MLRVIGTWLAWVLELGTAGYPPEIKIRLKIMNAIAYLIAFTTAGYTVQHLFLDYEKFKLLILLNASLAFVALLVPSCHRINEIAGGLLIVVAEWIALVLFMALLGRPSGVHLQYFVGAAAPFVVFGPNRMMLVLATVVSGIGLHIYTWFAFSRRDAIIDAGNEVLDSLYIQAAITTGALIAAVVWYAFALAAKAKAETDTLLRNVLPDSIVERLKDEPDRSIADSHADATVMFADISGFVALSRQLGPARVVDLLNDIVRRFDELAERHGIEKIKTIGDAYMAVAGVPDPVTDHGQRAAAMALDMLGAIAEVRAETGLDLHVRIGMASGPIMAGVIGTRKFSYDVWGDTVNLASRLESASERGAILICPGCEAVLSGTFICEPRGTIEIKGVGPQPTWFLKGRAAE
ncbi:MAG: adenylate/guanylate cyclase domain-containing protein [Hyphomicrobiaceae bacterium]|nr:adenylate/guanylate cyclase domain-containing protein [Hyphomicrobiaceae bacterium]